MKKIHYQELEGLEEKFGIKIIHAVELGSRSYGISTPVSDYDVKIIYHITDEALYNQTVNTDSFMMKACDRELDINGWQITKVVDMVKIANPLVVERLLSPICYFEEDPIIDKLRNILVKDFNYGSCLYQYLQISLDHYRKFLNDENVNEKKYLYALRTIMNCKWMDHYKSLPQLNFHKLMDFCIEDHRLLREVNELMTRKNLDVLGDKTGQLPLIQNYIKSQIDYFLSRNYRDHYLNKMETCILEEVR